MKVKLISYTPDALNLLLFSRNTRLRMSPDGYEEVAAWPEEKKREELEHARNTIQSSWAFIDYVFTIQGVTRAFTHQLVRHRIGTEFAQQSMRTVNMSSEDEGWTYEIGPSFKPKDMGRAMEEYQDGMRSIAQTYYRLVHDHKVPTEDARGILPTNIHTNILFKANLRTLHDMGLKRLCVKTQGEFQSVFREIRAAVIGVHPWAETFIRVHCAFHGNCAFPNFPIEKCYIKPEVYDGATGMSYEGGDPSSIDLIQETWEIHNGQGSRDN